MKPTPEHIEEARKLASDWALAECDEPCADAIAIALAAAKERGRLEEMERCAQIADEHALSCSSKINKKRSDHDLSVFESAASEAMSIAHCIRKEPTP